MNNLFWKNKKVFLTGHTGFKGSWLSLWLTSMGAVVTGYAMEPPTRPSLYEVTNINSLVHSVTGDIRDKELLSKAMKAANPDIVIHMAAQPLVRESYDNPVETYSVNVMGTVHLLEAVRYCNNVRAVINVATDKCYENKEWLWGYRETEPLGGYDPYSSSKACSELVTAAYQQSFFNPNNYDQHGTAIASARAGNVIGGGDWAKDRLIPDCMNSLIAGEEIVIRNPHAIRPWQHVLEPLSGYLSLAEKLFESGVKYGEAWNFGPDDRDVKSVLWLVESLCDKWGREARFRVDKENTHPHEANFLKLDCSKANARLNWHPKWDLNNALSRIIDWFESYLDHRRMDQFCWEQIKDYTNGGK
jgi:CDP-glucose 4,6-dehydratase